VSRGLEVEPLVWGEPGGFVEWFRQTWQPGEHVSVIAPTGAGKTTFVGGLLDGCRRYVLAIDPKGGDDTLGGLGYERLSRWPGNRKLHQMVADNDDNGMPSRYVVGPIIHTVADRERHTEVVRQALEGAYEMGNWTVYADELQILTDPRMMDLRKEVDRLLISARYKGLSFVSSYQAPSWVTPHAAKMSTWCAVSYTRDTDVVNRLAEILGRPKPEIRGALQGLDKYTWLMVGRDPREPVRVTLPDYLAPLSAE
jgi:hypothetical protein